MQKENKNCKNLSDFKEIIHRCSKCGLCQSVCPIYKTTGNECTVSRGQFIMLEGIINNKLKMSKTVNKYLDLCLKCNKCSDFCPSDIDVVDIILKAKHEYFKNSLSGKIYSIFESKLVFNTFLNLMGFISEIFHKQNKSSQHETKAVYFGGCISKIKPNINNYATVILNKIGIESVNKKFNCCGMPFLTTGNIDRFSEQAIENIKKLPDDISMIVTDCASCEWAWKQYPKYINDEKLLNKFSKIKIVSIYDIISDNNIKFTSKKDLTITYHKPCHEKHSEKIFEILNNIKNVTYKEMDGFDECCGFGSLEHPTTLKTAHPILKKKRDNIKNTSANIVITTCVGCLMNLNLISLFKYKTRRLLAFLKDNCTID